MQQRLASKKIIPNEMKAGDNNAIPKARQAIPIAAKSAAEEITVAGVIAGDVTTA